jgi:hypothetical protein
MFYFVFSATYKEFFLRVVDLFRECGEQYRGIEELLDGFAHEDLTFISSSSGQNKLLEVSNGLFDDEDDEDRDDCSPKKKARVRRAHY